MIGTGDTVRILAQGEFYGQEKPVTAIDRKPTGRVWYQVEVEWPEPRHVRPSWFEDFEVEEIPVDQHVEPS